MMASDDEMEIMRDEQQIPDCEPDFDLIAQKVQNLFKFKNFYDRMDFNIDQRLVITKIIIELIDSSGG